MECNANYSSHTLYGWFSSVGPWELQPPAVRRPLKKFTLTHISHPRTLRVSRMHFDLEWAEGPFFRGCLKKGGVPISKRTKFQQLLTFKLRSNILNTLLLAALYKPAFSITPHLMTYKTLPLTWGIARTAKHRRKGGGSSEGRAPIMLPSSLSCGLVYPRIAPTAGHALQPQSYFVATFFVQHELGKKCIKKQQQPKKKLN